MFHANDVIHCKRCFHVSIEGDHPAGTTQGRKLRCGQGRHGEIKRVCTRWRQGKKRCRQVWVYRRIEGWSDQGRRIGAHLVDGLTKCNPVVIDTNSATHAPVAGSRRIPGEADTRAEEILYGVGEHATDSLDSRICNLLCEIGSRTQKEIAEVEVLPPRGVIGKVIPT